MVAGASLAHGTRVARELDAVTYLGATITYVGDSVTYLEGEMASSVEPTESPGAARGSLWRRHTARPVTVALGVLTAGPIVVASVVAGLAAWLALALLERITRHARAAWVALATLTLAASLGAPLSGRGIDRGSRLVLTLLHLTVGTLLIVLLARTSRPARSAMPRRDR